MLSSTLDPDQCYQAMRARDRRFDGVFFVGVETTRIYCRPVCTVRLPRFDRCSFYRYAASAERAGYRPCLRCRPELAPGTAKVDSVRRVARIAAERIGAGALRRGGLEGLSRELGLSSRQLRRAIEAEFGVSPLELAQTYRLLLAKQLLTDTSLRVVDVAFASGFSSVRRFNAAFRERYRLSPTQLRKDREAASERGVRLRLGFRPPFAWRQLVEFLESRGSTRIERCVSERSDLEHRDSEQCDSEQGVPEHRDSEHRDSDCRDSDYRDSDRYARSLRVGDALGWVAVECDLARCQLRVEIAPSLLLHLVEVQAKLRALFDLDADPEAISSHLSRDALLAQRIETVPGIRVPGAIDPFELALRTVLGQQVSVKAASTLFARIVEHFGEAVETPFAGIDRVAPTAECVAGLPLSELRAIGLTGQRARTLSALAQALATGELDFGCTEPSELLQRLLALPGIGPWTAGYIAMRAKLDPDAFPVADLGLMRVLGLSRSSELEARSRAWAPWRSYAALYLWTPMPEGESS